MKGAEPGASATICHAPCFRLRRPTTGPVRLRRPTAGQVRLRITTAGQVRLRGTTAGQVRTRRAAQCRGSSLTSWQNDDQTRDSASPWAHTEDRCSLLVRVFVVHRGNSDWNRRTEDGHKFQRRWWPRYIRHRHVRRMALISAYSEGGMPIVSFDHVAGDCRWRQRRCLCLSKLFCEVENCNSRGWERRLK